MATPSNAEILDPEFLADQRARLRAERGGVGRLADALVTKINGMSRRREAGGAAEGFGRVDMTSVELESARREVANAEERLAEIDAALARLDAGTYGRCEDCGGPIGTARLEAIPETPRCVSCQAHPRHLRRVG